MSSDLPTVVFIDTETTGLHADARAWEVAMIRREAPYHDPGTDRLVRPGDDEHWLMVSDVDLTSADLRALQIGGFHGRHTAYGPSRHIKGLSSVKEATAARRVEEITRGAVLVGSNPAYDARVLEAMLRRHGLCPAWHYRVVDLPTFAAGRWTALDVRLPSWPAWRSEQMALQTGANVPPKGERHTALGDARWIRDWWDVLEARRAGRLDEALDWRARTRDSSS